MSGVHRDLRGTIWWTYGAGALAGFLCATAHLPLPWLIGPLFATGVAAALGRPRPIVNGSRQMGQAIIGATLGLYFTREVVGTLGGALPSMIIAGLGSLAMGFVGARLLRRRAGLAASTAFFACVPGGAAEMSVLGEREGGDPAVIALSHALRVAAVVTIVPFAFALWGVHGEDTWAPAARFTSLGGSSAVVVLGIAVSITARRLNIPNAWLLGPLAVSATLTAFGLGAGSIPRIVVIIGQIAIGCALGSRFRRELLRDARVLLPSLALVIAQGMVLMAVFGLAIGLVTRRSVPALLLSTAPGGVAEMCLTARTLRLGVPLVTSFHVLRLVLLLTCAPAAYRIWQGFQKKTAAPQDERAPAP